MIVSEKTLTQYSRLCIARMLDISDLALSEQLFAYDLTEVSQV